jgi:hypothetical protein
MVARAVLVPDTNILLHMLPLDQIPWRALVGADEVEIVLVPQVVRELEAKKYGESDKLKKRAQRVVSQLDKWVPSGARSGQIAEGIVLRLHPREPVVVDGLDPTVGDDRIVASALEIQALEPVIIVTGDIGMRMKAEARGLPPVLKVPDLYRLPEAAPPKASTKVPRVTVGFLEDGEESLREFASKRLGLSVAHLVPEAKELLAQARRPALLAKLTSFDLLQNGPPTEGAYERYLAELEQYDVTNAKVFEFAIGVANEGSAPAHDIIAEFWLPYNVYIYSREPPMPGRPRPRPLFPSLHVPVHRSQPEENESFTFKSLDDGSGYARVQVRRLMHSDTACYSLWAEVPDEALRGFSIKAKVLVASPASELETTLNIRIERDNRE